jgi:hypothetical protein
VPYNYLGDLYKDEIVKKLVEKGFEIKNVHGLNLIMEEMGLLKHCGNRWLTTEIAVKYTIYRGRTFDVNAWHSEIVDIIAEYLKKNRC